MPIITYFNGVNTSYNEGNIINISCAATGKPEPDVKWIHKEQVKSFGRRSTDLIVKNIRKEDAGFHTCRANNSAGSIERTLSLVVNCEYGKTFAFVCKVLLMLSGQQWEKLNKRDMHNVLDALSALTIYLIGSICNI